ncbi:response regulator transcription factor [Bacillus sp. B1-b2]|uniref:response regulator transcription factor n=1 Tax=Bacillus sp. B1-b2 TaxID=2653201 RepID=UPI0012614130|nr:response regulator [Bacillus sp. B1-b2]KAB7667618.1 response regulator [Bacillus sp. B1-b2]
MSNSLWKVLIADDEPIIREGIRSSINWEHLQMKVIDEAEDGEEAIERAILHSIDILLVDINMPIANGLKVIKRVKAELPDCQVVIITGYDEFKYAQEAVRLHVSDYLLKPVEPDLLVEILTNMREELVRIKDQKRLWNTTTEQITKNLATLKTEFCREWVLGKLSNEEVLSQLPFLHLPSYSPKQFLAIASSEYIESRNLMNERDKEAFQKKIMNQISALFLDYDILSFHDDMGIIIIAFQVIPQKFTEKVEEHLQKEWNMYLSIYRKNNEKDFSHISLLYKQYREQIQSEINISPIVRRAKNILEHQYADPTISLEKVALELQVSSVYLSRLFKQELGMNFVQLLTRKRIKQAMYLLQSTDSPIVTISEQIGYDTQHYFSTAFKKATGISPNKYRRNLIQQMEETKC